MVTTQRSYFTSAAQSQQICAVADEGEELLLDCGVGGTIAQVLFASFGTPLGTCAGGVSLGSCNAPETDTIVRILCLGQQSCTVRSETSIFGDPCPPSVRSRTLAIDVLCIVPELPSSSTTTSLGRSTDSTSPSDTALDDIGEADVGEAPEDEDDSTTATLAAVTGAVSSTSVTELQGTFRLCQDSVDVDSILNFDCGVGGTIISIRFASFGVPTGSCSSGNLQIGDCHSQFSEIIVAGFCTGRQFCTIPVSASIFGSPCTDRNLSLSAEIVCLGGAPPVTTMASRQTTGTTTATNEIIDDLGSGEEEETTSTPSHTPTSLPTGLPTSLPSGLPTSLPSGLPTSLPTGLPISLPTVGPTTQLQICGGKQDPTECSSRSVNDCLFNRINDLCPVLCSSCTCLNESDPDFCGPEWCNVGTQHICPATCGTCPGVTQPPSRSPTLLPTLIPSMTPSIAVCRDNPPHWTGSTGHGCNKYEEYLWCNENGSPGPGWIAGWGPLELYSSGGYSATDACCVCGGGTYEIPATQVTTLSQTTIPFSSLDCFFGAIQDDDFDGNKACSCTENCARCSIYPTQVECTMCMNNQYLQSGVCVPDCSANSSETEVGIGSFNRQCVLKPSEISIDCNENEQCECALDIPNCSSCTMVDSVAMNCTRCDLGNFLFSGTCHENCFSFRSAPLGIDGVCTTITHVTCALDEGGSGLSNIEIDCECLETDSQCTECSVIGGTTVNCTRCAEPLFLYRGGCYENCFGFRSAPYGVDGICSNNPPDTSSISSTTPPEPPVPDIESCQGGVLGPACACFEENRTSGLCSLCIVFDVQSGVPCHAFEGFECPGPGCISTLDGLCEAADGNTSLVIPIPDASRHITCLRCGQGLFYYQAACHTNCTSFRDAPTGIDGRCEALF